MKKALLGSRRSPCPHMDPSHRGKPSKHNRCMCSITGGPGPSPCQVARSRRRAPAPYSSAPLLGNVVRDRGAKRRQGRTRRGAGGARSDEDGAGHQGAPVGVSEEVASRRSGSGGQAGGRRRGARLLHGRGRSAAIVTVESVNREYGAAEHRGDKVGIIGRAVATIRRARSRGSVPRGRIATEPFRRPPGAIVRRQVTKGSWSPAASGPGPRGPGTCFSFPPAAPRTSR